MNITETTTLDPRQTAARRGLASWKWIKNLLKSPEFILLLVVIGLIAGGWLKNPNMLNEDNLKIMTRDIAILGIAAVGVGFTIITGGIDLSVGSMVGFGGVMVAYFMKEYGWAIWISIIATLGLGGLVGLTHGLFVTKLKMHGFLITLVTMGLARGFVLVITESFPITGLTDDFKYLGQGYFFDLIPIPVVICLVVVALAFYLLRYTYIGRQIYAAGGNAEAARYSGVNVDRRVILAYILSAVCAVVVGMIQAARMGLGHPGTGEGYELLAIAACVLGGYSLMGGEGTIPGVVVGAMLIGVLQNEMVILRIDPYYHKIIIYSVLLIAITIDYARRRRRRV
ncbi:ABC transporter permease [Aggregatilinea lenta]|uniref:ABC transporter permease n=1 Tax=Aggregatilinea lenta TaxID=913108 RepID=UPI000E5C3614|nr:ABC transporter permease [Aggregatilinea lenta]